MSVRLHAANGHLVIVISLLRDPADALNSFSLLYVLHDQTQDYMACELTTVCRFMLCIPDVRMQSRCMHEAFSSCDNLTCCRVLSKPMAASLCLVSFYQGQAIATIEMTSHWW